jgi:hypothetical protein
MPLSHLIVSADVASAVLLHHGRCRQLTAKLLLETPDHLLHPQQSAILVHIITTPLQHALIPASTS